MMEFRLGGAAKRKKRVSLRRWKARCRVGRVIPRLAIVEYGLDRWFDFRPSPNSYNMDVWVAKRREG